MKNKNNKLRNTLLINASFSSISAFILLTSTEFISELMGFSDSYGVQIVGVGLVLFAALVGFVAIKKVTHAPWVILIIVQDVLWVCASMLVILLHPWDIHQIGEEIIAVVAVIIGVLAGLQYTFLKSNMAKDSVYHSS